MKKIIPWILFCLILASGIKQPQAVEMTEGSPLWLTNVEAALADANEENKPLLLYFSGSDWCGWCKRLDADVFSKDEFKTYADENLVLLLADFPQYTEQDEALAAQNNQLRMRFQVETFPTLLLFNPDGMLIGKLGYQPGGPEVFIQTIDRAIARSQMAAPSAPPGPRQPR